MGATEWRPVVGYESTHEVSNTGLIRSLPRVSKRTINGVESPYPVKGRVLKQHLMHRGYLYVDLVVDGRAKKIRPHRAVAQAFIPNPDNKPEVNHIDNDRTNNEVTNLQWVTSKENSEHMVAQGRHRNQYT